MVVCLTFLKGSTMPRIPTPPTVWTTTGAQAQMAPVPQQVTTDPTALLKGFPGQQVINTTNQSIWEYTGSQWIVLSNAGGGAGVFTSLTVAPGPTSLTGALTTISGANATNIATDNAAGAVNIGTTGARTSIFGSTTALAITTVRSGTGGGNVTSTGLQTISSSLANDAAINLTASDALGGLNISAAAGTIVAQYRAAGEVHTLTNLPWTLATGTGTINVSNDATATTANFGTGGGVKTVRVGSTNTTSTTTIQGGPTGGIALTGSGLVSVDPAVDTQASPTAASTINARVGRVTFTGFTTAAAASQVFTITDNLVVANSAIIVTAQNAGADDAQMTVARVNPGVGSFTVTLRNDGAAALNGNVIISFWVLS